MTGFDTQKRQNIKEKEKIFMRRVDFEIGLFLKGLEKEGLGDKVNVVLTSDHGKVFFGRRAHIFPQN